MNLNPEPRGDAGHCQISWIVRLSIKPDQLTTFAELTGEMVQATRLERGVLSYQRFVSSDNHCVHVYERYTDSSAALAHLLRFLSRFGERFSTLVERRDFSVYGNPSDELKRVLDSFGAHYLTPFAGFHY